VDEHLAFAQPDPLALPGGAQPGGSYQLPGAGHLVDQLAHVLHELLGWLLAGLLVDADQSIGTS
jgi:hypothetical protein